MQMPYSRAVAASAAVSFPKHEPPQPKPACRNRLPMRESRPMPRTTWVISAPTRSAKCPTSLAKLIFTERNALAAYLINSAEVRLAVTTGTAPKPSGRGRKFGAVKLCSMMGLYRV